MCRGLKLRHPSRIIHVWGLMMKHCALLLCLMVSSAACSTAPITGGAEDSGTVGAPDAVVGDDAEGPGGEDAGSDATGQLCKTAADCVDGGPCTVATCDEALGCVYETDPDPACCPDDAACDDGDPCTEDSCGVESRCVHEEPEGGCQQLCSLSGDAGTAVRCHVRLAQLRGSEAPAVALGLGFSWDPAAATLTRLIDDQCVGDCAAFSLPPQVRLKPTNHRVVFEPEPAAGGWTGGELGVQISHVEDPKTPVTGAVIEGDEITAADPDVFTLEFRLHAATDGAVVALLTVDARDPGDNALTVGIFDDGLLVTTSDACGGDVCWDGNPCTADNCEDDVCSLDLGDLSCDDGDPCTTDERCTAGGLCVADSFADAGTECPGGEDLCLGAGACDGAGECVADSSQAVVCDAPTDPCLSSACNPITGACVTSPAPGGTCDDDDACTDNDTCTDGGQCAGTAFDCDDGTGCTLDTCDKDDGCSFVVDHSLCDDGNECSDDSCDEATGCVFVANTAGCDDGDALTDDDTCLNGTCKGTPQAPCVSDEGCAEFDDGNACNGTVVCDPAIGCVIDPSSVVVCPSDGFECTVDWTCEPATGECSGDALDCDDDDDCTVDSCSVTKGCEYELLAGCQQTDFCAVSGTAGSTFECPIRIVRTAAATPAPSGGDLKMHWDTTKVQLDNLGDEFCIVQCFPFDLIACGPDGLDCSAQKLDPTGHDLVVTPTNAADWDGWLSILVFHAGAPNTPLTDAVGTGGGVSAGEPLLMNARFELLEDIPAETPLWVGVSDYHFNPATGLPMDVSLDPVDGTPTFVVSAP